MNCSRLRERKPNSLLAPATTSHIADDFPHQGRRNGCPIGATSRRLDAVCVAGKYWPGRRSPASTRQANVPRRNFGLSDIDGLLPPPSEAADPGIGMTESV